ncbi:Bgt-51879 [Blumeria graminis f. sp. tritici]|uniref:Bgt-51879 n=1 Tax=Blumeria graminis f. sp. tritici TaxID=62690 RepID=A0A9X9LBT9_BLUGR|nr:Bgt-51879 [Blumeria graminis f. sp. tritici]
MHVTANSVLSFTSVVT